MHMSYNIKLYVHGVPNGQDSWGVEDFDNSYIDSFYGRKFKVPAQLFVEVMRFGSNVNCYYTYMQTENVQDKDGRTGSYLALTLRINYYYADLRNMYNLLEAAYNKFIVGEVVENTGCGILYKIADFAQADTMLGTLEKELEKYLMQFSVDADFVSLNGIALPKKQQVDIISVNPLECDTNILLSYIKKGGKISVSSLHSTKHEQLIIQNMSSEIQATQRKAQHDIQTVLHDKESEIQTIKNEYKDVEHTIAKLKKKAENANGEIERLNIELSNAKKELEETKKYEQKYLDAQKEFNKFNEFIESIENNLSVLKETTSKVSNMNNSSRNIESRGDSCESSGKSVVRKYRFIFCFAIVLMMGIIAFFSFRSCTNKKEKMEINVEKNNDTLQRTVENKSLDIPD